MSLIENGLFLENAYENFSEALERKDWSSAKAVIEDCNGFESAQKVMGYELTKAQKGHLAAIKSIE